MPDALDSTTTTAEAAGQPAPSSLSPAPVQPSTERKELASFGDALRQTARTERTAARKTDDQPDQPPASGSTGDSATRASTSRQPTRSSDRPSAPTDADDDGDSTDAVSTPTEEGTEGSETQPVAGEKPSRRGSAQIRDLTAERDTLKARVDALEAAAVIPESVTQQLRGVMLDDGAFAALEEKLKREDLDGAYLTAEERQQYTAALQVRALLRPAFALAQTQAAAWANEQQQAVIQRAANELAPVLRESDYIKPDPIGRAESWGTIYRYIRDVSFEAGGTAKATELQPKLDEKDARINDLESELSGLRVHDASRGRALERGGVPGGAVTATPAYSSSSSSALFAAALAREERSRNGRRAAAARSS